MSERSSAPAAACARCAEQFVADDKRLYYAYTFDPRCDFCGVEIEARAAIAFDQPGTMCGGILSDLASRLRF